MRLRIGVGVASAQAFGHHERFERFLFSKDAEHGILRDPDGVVDGRVVHDGVQDGLTHFFDDGRVVATHELQPLDVDVIVRVGVRVHQPGVPFFRIQQVGFINFLEFELHAPRKRLGDFFRDPLRDAEMFPEIVAQGLGHVEPDHDGVGIVHDQASDAGREMMVGRGRVVDVRARIGD